jgi:hypothetical protein
VAGEAWDATMVRGVGGAVAEAGWASGWLDLTSAAVSGWTLTAA